MATECILAIAGSEVFGASDLSDAATWFANHPNVTEVVRMPKSAAGRFLFQPWPGRQAALTLLASLPAPEGDVPGEAQTGPRTITTSRQTCEGCPALELKDWSFEGENDDMDSGTSAKCSASAGKRIAAYWSALNTTPDWCPALNLSSGEAQTQEGGR